ncbi:hypothetical protein COLO4_15957 [Corchorus olitorius]|uniref:F-box domain-containing protein n=1 Tax=Corchorus olitorius TaxID=93759 RepID=A0A1R3JKH0_9ROSI|nr:hypothetical protein COLO4_15957 [Corchorus olitorius]
MSEYLSISVPDEICIEILERLPVKSLVRFKATRKSWKSLINDPSFVDHHLNRSAAARCNKLVIFEELGNNSSNSVVRFLDLGNPSQTTMMEFPSTARTRRIVIFPFAILVPGKSWKIPNPPLPNSEYLKRHYAAALGYDFFVKTYKVVILRKGYCAVYNVKTNSWSDFEVEDDDLNPARWRYYLTLANGAPHWIKVDFYRSSHDDKFKVEIWVMMEHGVGESWTRLALSCDEIPTGKLYKPISFAKDGMISLVKEDNGVAIYIGKTKRIEIKTIKTRIDVLFRMLTSPYVESLVSI